MPAAIPTIQFVPDPSEKLIQLLIEVQKPTPPLATQTRLCNKIKACSHLIHLTLRLLRACSRGQRLSGHLRKANNIAPFCLSPDQAHMDPFSQMKREYNTILDDADSANRNNFVPSQLYMMLSEKLF